MTKLKCQLLTRILIMITIFFTVLYRSPSFHLATAEFADFISNFRELYSKIKQEKPYMTFFTGDFNGQSQYWYPDGVTTPEGN